MSTTARPAGQAAPGTASENRYGETVPRPRRGRRAFLIGAAAAGVSKLPTELDQILTLHAAHGETALLAALDRAVRVQTVARR